MEFPKFWNSIPEVIYASLNGSEKTLRSAENRQPIFISDISCCSLKSMFFQHIISFLFQRVKYMKNSCWSYRNCIDNFSACHAFGVWLTHNHNVKIGETCIDSVGLFIASGYTYWFMINAKLTLTIEQRRPLYCIDW